MAPAVISLTPPNCRGAPHPARVMTLDLTPVLEAQIAALRAVSELLRAQLTDTREECDRWRQEAERLALPPPAPVPKPLRRRTPLVATGLVARLFQGRMTRNPDIVRVRSDVDCARTWLHHGDANLMVDTPMIKVRMTD